jgi:hypothetical protein
MKNIKWGILYDQICDGAWRYYFRSFFYAVLSFIPLYAFLSLLTPFVSQVSGGYIILTGNSFFATVLAPWLFVGLALVYALIIAPPIYFLEKSYYSYKNKILWGVIFMFTPVYIIVTTILCAYKQCYI